MPQFDFFTFSTQSFWILFFFGNFYFLILTSLIVKFAELLKLRQKLQSLRNLKEIFPKKSISISDQYYKAFIISFKRK